MNSQRFFSIIEIAFIIFLLLLLNSKDVLRPFLIYFEFSFAFRCTGFDITPTSTWSPGLDTFFDKHMEVCVYTRPD